MHHRSHNGGGSVWRAVSVQGDLCPGVCLGGLCLGGSLSRRSLSRGSLSREVSVWGSLSGGVSVQGDLCQEGSLFRGISVQGGSLLGRTIPDRDHPYGKERAVCILLECVLASSLYQQFRGCCIVPAKM